MSRRSSFALTVAVAALLVAGFVGASQPSRRTARGAAAAQEVEHEGEELGGEERGAESEAEEQAESTQERLEALAEARAEGTFGTPERIAAAPAAGWAGEQLMNVTTDDWEPAIAADPNAPFVYLITTRYAPKPCPGNCPSPWIALEVSSDGGTTWSDGRPLCACKGSGQFDPIIEVVPNTGQVYAVYMSGFNVVFTKSSDHGQTWTAPVPTWGQVAWNDKPALATSDDGRHVYLSWNGPTGGDPWIAQSHDFGATWSQTEAVDSKRYFFAFDAEVLSDGTAIISESSFDYSGPAGAAVGQVRHHAFISRDEGETWQNVVLGSVELGEPCVSEGCYADFYAGHNAVTADEDDDLVYAFDGATTPLGPQRVFLRRSTDAGATWSTTIAISSPGRMATGPTAEATGNGDVRVWFAQRAPEDRWNIWYRRSTNGGVTWSSKVRISDATSGADYKNEDGFLEFYGDYGEIAITNAGKTIGVWGEAFSYTGPGGTWFNRQT